MEVGKHAMHALPALQLQCCYCFHASLHVGAGAPCHSAEVLRSLGSAIIRHALPVSAGEPLPIQLVQLIYSQIPGIKVYNW